MKCFVITMLFIGISIFAYSQTSFPYPKSIQGHKNDLIPFSSSKNYITIPAAGSSVKCTGNTIPAYKPDLSILSVIPTLKLWLLPANTPNPFMKEDE